jgi:hypothetical protein
MIPVISNLLEKRINLATALRKISDMYWRGGAVIVTSDMKKRALIETIIQPDGDVITKLTCQQIDDKLWKAHQAKIVSIITSISTLRWTLKRVVWSLSILIPLGWETYNILVRHAGWVWSWRYLADLLGVIVIYIAGRILGILAKRLFKKFGQRFTKFEWSFPKV